MEDVTKLDLYDLLEISHDATSKEIKTAYRKKALKCHPDKNPDNPIAVKLFHQLSRALEILTDGGAKDAYDKILKARKAAEIRNRQMDSKRKKLKEDLEQRERAAELQQQQEYSPADATKRLQVEIERLRKEGSRQLEEEVRIMKEQLKAEMERLIADKEDTGIILPRLKVQWKQAKGEASTRYTHNSLMERFTKYGVVTGLVMSSKSRALVEFAREEYAEEALANEMGFEDSPLKVSWINRPSSSAPAAAKEGQRMEKEGGEQECKLNSSVSNSERDYENIVLMKLRQAEERKRLIQQMQDDDLGKT